jgi:hypothetical protein
MNAIANKNMSCSERRSAKVQDLKEHIQAGRYQIDVFRVAQAMLNHVDRGVEKGVELALAFHMRAASEEDSDISDLLK